MEPDINNGMKEYQCTLCKHECEIDTNHFGECMNFCKVCDPPQFTVHKFTGEVPEGGWIPDKWQPVINPNDN